MENPTILNSVESWIAISRESIRAHSHAGINTMRLDKLDCGRRVAPQLEISSRPQLVARNLARSLSWFFYGVPSCSLFFGGCQPFSLV